jgi:hypothetical protein
MADNRPKYKLEITDQGRGYSRTLEVGSITDLLEIATNGNSLIENWLLEVRDDTN